MAMFRSQRKRKGVLLQFHPTGKRVTALVTTLALTLAVSVGAASASSTHATAGNTVFAGSSMTSVLPVIDSGNTYSFGSTGTLATQITNGAPADVLMGANTTTCASLYASGVAEKPVNFTRNTLEAVVPKANPAGIKSIYDLAKPGITVDVAASSVPVGAYTVQVLNQMGINSAIQANVVSQETDDANVVSKVATGQVDAGFVYLSDYITDPSQLTLITVPAWAQPKITYSMCVMAKSPNQAAATAWVNKILSASGQAVFVKDGFLPLTAPVPTITKLDAGQGEEGRDPDDHRHEPEGHDVGHLPGRSVEVQGRLGRKAHGHRAREGQDRDAHRHEPVRYRDAEADHDQVMPDTAPRSRSATPAGRVVATSCRSPRARLFQARRRGTAGRILEHALDEVRHRAGRLQPETDEDVLGPDAAPEPGLERGDRRQRERELSLEQGPAVEPRALDQHELEQEERARIADVVDRFREPAGESLAPLGRCLEERTVGASRSGLAAHRLDQPSALQQVDCAVDERPADRPDASDLAVSGHGLRDRPTVGGRVGEQG